MATSKSIGHRIRVVLRSGVVLRQEFYYPAKPPEPQPAIVDDCDFDPDADDRAFYATGDEFESDE